MPSENSKAARERRRTEAEARQAERAKRSKGHHEAILAQRPGASAKERARLEAKA
jgi:hypothetical protein